MQNVFRILLLLLFSNGMFGQCYPLSTGATTITGSYTADINPPFGSIIYITSTATVTGNIYLNNSSLLNCGTILSRKVVMKQNVNNHMHGIQNSNLMICDSVILDSLGHLHNNDSLICRFFQMGYSASADNYYFMEAKTSSIEEGSWFSSLASFKADYFSLKGNTATANQFFVTDSVKHFLRGALYFNATPNEDSLRPEPDQADEAMVRGDIDQRVLERLQPFTDLRCGCKGDA